MSKCLKGLKIIRILELQKMKYNSQVLFLCVLVGRPDLKQSKAGGKTKPRIGETLECTNLKISEL